MSDLSAHVAMAELRNALREANDWLKAGEGIDLLHYWPTTEMPGLRALVEETIANG